MKLSSEKKIRKKNSSFFNNMNNKTNNNQKTSNLTTITTNNNIKSNKNEIRHFNTPKEHHLYNIFDEEGTKAFLASKEKAMMEIILDDETKIEDGEENAIIKKKSSNFKNDKKNENEANGKQNKYNDNKNKKNSKYKNQESNIYKDKDKKSSKKSNKNSCNKNNDNKNNIIIVDKENNESKDSEFIYKFIIENANESEDKFHKKLEKALKKAETIKKVLKIESNDDHKKKRNTVYGNSRYNSDKGVKKASIFDFSEKAKILMTNADIEISSIGHNSDKSIKKIHKNHSTKIKINNKKNSAFFGEDVKEYINGKNDSLISVLDEFN